MDSDSGDSEDDVEPREPDARAFVDALQSLPTVRDDFYLHSQIFSLGVVASLIEQQETAMMRSYWVDDKVPADVFLVVSALSQIWVLGVYEVLRTWRQRLRSILAFVDRLPPDPEDRQAAVKSRVAAVRARFAHPSLVQQTHATVYETAADSEEYTQELRTAYLRSERPFRRLEALRINLAKHEIPQQKDTFAQGAGAGRIDTLSGTIQWHIDLGNQEVDVVSRKAVMEACIKLASADPLQILPPELRSVVKTFPTLSYGVKAVILDMVDGSECKAFVAWNQEIISIVGRPPDSIAIAEIRSVRPAPE